MPTSGDSASPSSVTARSGGFCELALLPEAFFGAVMRFPALSGAREAVAALEDVPETLGAAVCEHGGLLLLPEMDDISDEPDLLLRLSKLLGPEVEDYRNSYAFVKGNRDRRQSCGSGVRGNTRAFAQHSTTSATAHCGIVAP